MNNQQELRLRGWLAGRDPGDVPPTLRSTVAAVPDDVGARFPWFAALINGACAGSPTRAAWMVAAIALLLVTLVVVGAGILIQKLITAPRFPPPGLIAYAALDREMWTVRADGSDARALTQTADGEINPQWSPDGRTLLFTRLIGEASLESCISFTSSSLVIFDIGTSTERILLTQEGFAYAAAWSPDGREIAYLDMDVAGCQIGDDPRALGGGLIEVSSGQVRAIPAGAGSAWQEWIGSSIAYVFADRIGFVDPAAGQPGELRDIFRFDGPGWGVSSGDGRFVALWKAQRDLSGNLVIADRTTGGRMDLGPGGAASWSPDSSSVVFLGAETDPGPAGSRSLVVATAPGWQPRTIGTVVVPPLQGGQLVQSVPELAWTQDGSAIYWLEDGQARVIEVATGQVAALPDRLQGCVDLHWQPVP